MDSKETDRRAYGPLVQEANARGIGRTVAFQLARDGIIETFNIGRRRFVILESLDSLPQRLAEREQEAA
jgi:hypothetical protein